MDQGHQEPVLPTSLREVECSQLGVEVEAVEVVVAVGAAKSAESPLPEEVEAATESVRLAAAAILAADTPSGSQ